MPLYARTLLVTATGEEVERAVEGHLRHLEDLRALGRLRAAGRFPKGDGFLDIFEARDLLDAEATARDTPLVEEGLATWLVREWIELGP